MISSGLQYFQQVFWEPQTGVAGTLEELKKLQGFINVQGTNVRHLAEVWASKTTQETDSTEKNPKQM